MVDEEPRLTVAAVARRMGIAPATLRTWDRRYGLGPSSHEAGTHRRYGTSDLDRLERMRRLVIEGVPPAEAARIACGESASADSGAETVRAGGGRIIAHPGAGPTERGLARAAHALDTRSCEALVADSIDRVGVVATWDRLVVPVLRAIGDRWESTGRGVEIEHALSCAVQAAMMGEIGRLRTPVNTRTVLLTCAAGEVHTLPLWAVAAALSERGICSRVLAPGLPPVALLDATTRLRPAAVFLWAQIPGTAECTMLADLPEFRPKSVIVVGGEGWCACLPAGVTRAIDITDTVASLARAIGE